MRKKKPNYPMTAWEYAEISYGKRAVDENHLLAGKAAQQQRQAGWTFLEYDWNGDEVWEPPQKKD